MDLVFQSNRTIEHGVDNGGLLLLLFCLGFEISFVCMQLQAPFSYLENLAGPVAW